MFTLSSRVVFNHIPSLTPALVRGAARNALLSANELRNDLNQQMRLPKTGRRYRRGQSAWHQASAPGEAPAVDSGTYSTGIWAELVGPLTAITATASAYALALELGTRRIKPRPAWKPGLKRVTVNWDRRNRELLALR